MMSLETLLAGLTIISGIIIIHYVLEVLDCMNGTTHHGIRFVFVLMGGGGFLQVMGALAPGDIAEWGNNLLSTSVAMLFLFDRRTTATKRALIIGTARRERFTKEINT